MADRELIFTSLGMFIIDDNEYPESWNRKPEHNVIGGGGSYSIVGARFVAGDKYGKQVSGIIDKGRDFPIEIEKELINWDTGIIFRYDDKRLTTRGRNRYDEHEIRHFDYLTEKKRIELIDVYDENLVNSKCFHIICSFTRCEELIDGIRKYNPGAVFIYEPLPSDCIYENYDKMVKLLPKVDIFTPNLNEGCQLLGIKEPTDLRTMQDISKKYTTLGCKNFVLRCGPLGCIVACSSLIKHIPAYHQDQSKVIDVTGGGNSFCGGFMMAYYLSKDLIISGVFGNLTSGCIIEKLAMPIKQGQLWNGKSVSDRLKIYLDNNDIDIDLNKINWI